MPAELLAGTLSRIGTPWIQVTSATIHIAYLVH
jgi:hypothetical protein